MGRALFRGHVPYRRRWWMADVRGDLVRAGIPDVPKWWCRACQTFDDRGRFDYFVFMPWGLHYFGRLWYGHPNALLFLAIDVGFLEVGEMGYVRKQDAIAHGTLHRWRWDFWRCRRERRERIAQFLRDLTPSEACKD